MKKILITGGEGYIGSNLVKRLSEDFDVIVFDYLDNKNPENINYTYFQGDLTNEKELEKIKENIDGIIHLAGISNVKDGNNNPHECVRINVLGTLNILDFAKNKANQPWIIYGGTNEKTENIYGLSKHMSELLIERFAKDYNLKTISLRFSTIYGSKDKSNKLIPKLINQAIRNQDITLDNSKKSFDFIYIDDLIEGICKGMDYIEGIHPPYYDFFRLCTGKNTSLKELAEIILRKTNSHSKLIILEQKGESQEAYETEKSEKLLGFKSKTNIEEGLEKTIRSFKNA